MAYEKQVSVELTKEELKEREANQTVVPPVVQQPYDQNNNSGKGKDGTIAPKDRMPMKTKIFYAFGHVYNDMTVSIWFSYTLLFFENRLTGGLAGSLLLLGQIADAIASPFIGFASDKLANRWPFNKYGRRKVWHLLGVILSTFSVPLVYNRCLIGDHQPPSVQFIYYGVLAFIFQSAWAATQVTHVALVNDLTPHQSERIALNSYRQAATMFSNILMFMITYFLLRNVAEGDEASASMTIQQEDMVVFTYLSYIVCAIGVVVSLFFYMFIHEPSTPPKAASVLESPEDTNSKLQHVFSLPQHLKNVESIITGKEKKTCTLTLARPLCEDAITANEKSNSPDTLSQSSQAQDTESLIRSGQKKWYSWFKSLSFWKLTTIYTAARMFINVSQVYVPIYLQHYLLLPKHTVAIIPLTTYIASFVFSFVTSFTSKRWGSRLSIIIGAILAVIAAAWIWIGNDDASMRSIQIYFVACLIGIAGTFLLISSLSINNDLVAGNSKTNAFVFALMSFFDKGINGFIIEGIEQFKPSHGVESGKTHQPLVYYKWVMVVLTGVPAIAILLMLLTIWRTKYGRKAPKGAAPVMAAH